MGLVLKYLRRTIAVIVLALLLIYFLDFAKIVPKEINFLTKIQIVPALLSGAWIIVAIITLTTLLFGRIYCSVVCPLGIMQDGIIRIKEWYGKLFHKKLPTWKHTKAHNIIWYSILAVCLLTLIKSTVVLALLDPYSIFGRIASDLFKPIYVEANNLLASALSSMGMYGLYNTTTTTTLPLITIAITTFIIVLLMAWRKERLWCNSVCPVGAVLGVVSRYSVFGIKLSDKCTGCGKCSNVCKSHCIDHSTKSVDNARCVGCFNCLDSKCSLNGVEYGFRYVKTAKKECSCDNTPADPSRRRFIAGVSASVAMLPVMSVAAQVGVKVKRERTFPMPPGATEDFATRCTGCQLCITKCRMKLLRPSFMERGITGIMQPHMYFETHKYCNYDCHYCSTVCPTGALKPLSKEEKKLCKVGEVKFIRKHCLVERNHEDCGACAEHCPTGAVAMVAYMDGLTIPQIDKDRCIGCGACESICPERPRAIYVEGLDPQGIAKPPIFSEKQNVEVDGFGF